MTTEHQVIPDKPDHPCNWCGKYAWYLPGDYYYGRKRWICGSCHPAPVMIFEPALTGKKGRPAFNINLDLICDALKQCGNIKQAAITLGCSRAYIYKIAGVDTVRQCIRGVTHDSEV